jgi:hypothetical protein
MKHMDWPEDEREKINFSDPNLPQAVRILRPLVFKDGENFCVVLGPNPQEGVFGCGKTANEALHDWNNNLNERLGQDDDSDELAKEIIITLADAK